MNIIIFFKNLWLKREAKRNSVPFRKRMWYNLQAMYPKVKQVDKSFIECFDVNGKYINCPGIGGTVIYNDKGRRFRYRIVGFQNDSRFRDWLYDSDYINPVVEYLGKAREE